MIESCWLHDELWVTSRACERDVMWPVIMLPPPSPHMPSDPSHRPQSNPIGYQAAAQPSACPISYQLMFDPQGNTVAKNIILYCSGYKLYHRCSHTFMALHRVYISYKTLMDRSELSYTPHVWSMCRKTPISPHYVCSYISRCVPQQ